MTTAKQLKKLYDNKNLLVFINGEKWFNSQVEAIHAKNVGFDKAVVEAVCWEMDNGYFEEAQE